ncbi:MAG: type II toxin-antitoxin system VapC family toxin [Ruminococcus sp.]|nr:type II toxin-antitoxin system VapC family toxin [Ruminococcus sp.]
MKYLMDTHILLWLLLSPNVLPPEAQKIICDPNNRFAYSVMSLLEIEIKHLKHPAGLTVGAENVEVFCRKSEFDRIDISVESIYELKNLRLKENAPRHIDPFDRILICQAQVNGCLLLTHDSKLPYYDSSCIRFV